MVVVHSLSVADLCRPVLSVQREVADSIRDNRYTALPSAHDTGKSFNW
jgi:hypothetical protein